MPHLKNTKFTRDISIVLCGEAGQGIKTIDFALTHILKNAGFYVFSTKEYMSRIRGGCNSTEIRVSNYPVNSYVDRIDIFIPLSKKAFFHLENRISKKTLIIGKNEHIPTEYQFIKLDLEKLAIDVGKKTYLNSIAIGFILGLFNIDQKEYAAFFFNYFKDKGDITVNKNINAANKGYEFSENLPSKNEFKLKPGIAKNQKIFNGSEAITLGAIAGNCNFISSYPMSPGTGVLTNLALYSQKYDIIVEQAEDEITAINMALGAWYAGARALITTSGGGFALMTEGISLSGMTETPIVIHLGQRPGPATGLPTRTEQGDLNLALYAGHGEFPRVIFTPGSIEQAFTLTQEAFDLADKYQIPVIILTDQYFLDSYYLITPSKLKFINTNNHISKSQKNYKRYELTKSGISPRCIPGFGAGLVCVDSDEHTEEGYITEDLNLRTKMVEKRLKKFKSLMNEFVMPEFKGNKNYKYLIISWGSNYHVIKEALCTINNPYIAYLHFSQVFPLSKKITKYFNQSVKTIVIENNATAQFAELLKQKLLIQIDETILKFNGLSFSVEEMIKEINSKLLRRNK